jgi:hypothetical protein
MSKKKALEKGKNQGELIRLKQTLRKQNEIILKSKKHESDGGASTAAVSLYLLRILGDLELLRVPPPREATS